MSTAMLSRLPPSARPSGRRSRTSSPSPATSSSTGPIRPVRSTSSARWRPRAPPSSAATPISPSPTSTIWLPSRGRPMACPTPFVLPPNGRTTRSATSGSPGCGGRRVRGLPWERRLHGEDGTMLLVCHASPGSQTAGFDKELDPNVVIERASRTDARVIVCGHTHVPEVRDLGWKIIVNDGSAGYVFDGDPTASWARIDLVDGEVQAEIIRTEYDVIEVANAISARGLPGDVYRAATVRTGKLVR